MQDYGASFWICYYTARAASWESAREMSGQNISLSVLSHVTKQRAAHYKNAPAPSREMGLSVLIFH